MKIDSVGMLALLWIVAGGPVPLGQAQEPINTRITQRAILEHLADNVIAPRYRVLGETSIQLNAAIAAFHDLPSPETLARSREAWLNVGEAAARLSCWQSGPIVEREYASTFYYWPAQPRRIEALLSSSRSIDQALLDEQGATVKGLYALEYLLFDDSTVVLPRFSESPRRAAYLRALAEEIATQAEQLASDWTATGRGSARTQFVGGGTETFNLAVNNLAQAAEQVYDRRLSFPLLLPHPVSRQLERIRGAPSGTSLREAIWTLEGVRELYQGGPGLGLDDKLQRINAPLHRRLEEQFAATFMAMTAIAVPLEQALVDNRDRIQSAADQARVLEILLKVDLASSLGVTITFSSGDGD